MVLRARSALAPLLFVALAGMFPVSRIWAQQTVEYAAQPAVPVDSAESGGAKGGDPFARYRIAEECAMHAVRMERQYWRDKRPDTLTVGPWGNPLQRSTIASVQRCLSRFSVAATPVRDVIILGRAYLVAEQDAKADSAFRKALTANASKPVEERAWLLQQIISATLQVSPMRLAAADRYLAELDRLGAGAAVSRMLAHTAMAQAGAIADSVAMQGEHAKAAVAAGKQMTGDDPKQRVREEFEARRQLVDWYLRRAVYDSARIEARAVLADLTGRRRFFRFERWVAAVDWAGTQAPRLERTWTFNNPDSASFPVAGTPTLVILSSAVCGSQCYAGYAPIRRLGAKYPSSKLRMVVITPTYGFAGNHLLTPAKESEKARQFFLEYQRLPAAVDVQQTPFTVRDDGVRMDRYPEWMEAYWSKNVTADDYTGVVLVDRNGNVRMAGGLNGRTERRFDHLIAELHSLAE